MSKGLVRDDIDTRVYGEHEQRLGRGEKHVDGEFVYVGTYPGGASTTPDSPVFKNAWAADTTDPPRFRWLLSGTPEIRGKWKNGADDTVVFTLPTKARPDNDYTIPYCGVSNCVGSITVKTNGDVTWHEPGGVSARGAVYEDLMLAYSSSLVGWWRLGENPNNADLAADTFKFQNSAPGSGLKALVANPYTPQGVFPLVLSLGPNGRGPAQLGSNDDGALMSPGFQNNRLATVAAYGQYLDGNDQWTMMCWFLPGYDKTFPAPSPVAANGQGFICGVMEMDVGGAANEGVGFMWRPYYFDPTTGYGPALSLWRKGGGSTEVNIPIPTTGTKVTTWWDNHNYPTPAADDYPEVLPVPLEQTGPYDPWFHIAASYDGTNIRVFINGLLADTVASPFAVTGISTSSFFALSAQIDTGFTEYTSTLKGAVDEIALFSTRLADGAILDIVNAAT